MVRNVRIIIFLGILLAVGGMCIAKLSGGENRLTADSELSVKSNPAQINRDANSLFNSNQFSTSEMFYKMIFAIVVVIVLAIAAVFVLKKLPMIAKLPSRQIKVIESISLGQHCRIHIIEAGGRKLLIGSTNQTITRLADLSEPVDLTESV